MSNKTKQHYVYKITNNVNGKYYYGKRTCYGLAINDPYMGSGIGITQAIKTHGVENFTKEILSYCANEEEAYRTEASYITPSEVNNPNCYNKCINGRKPLNIIDRTTDINHYKALYEQSQETIKLYAATVKMHSNITKHYEETIIAKNNTINEQQAQINKLSELVSVKTTKFDTSNTYDIFYIMQELGYSELGAVEFRNNILSQYVINKYVKYANTGGSRFILTDNYYRDFYTNCTIDGNTYSVKKSIIINNAK